MQIEELQELLSGVDFDKVKETIVAEKGKSSNVDEALKQYNVADHEIFDEATRKDKTITTDKGQTIVKLNRLGLDFQVLISFRHAAMLCANKIKLEATAEDTPTKEYLSLIQKIWDDNKLDYATLALCEMMLSETEVAELWYLEKLEAKEGYWAGTKNEGRPWRLRSGILAKSLGDDLYPVFDGKKDLIAFGRGYKIKVKGQDEEHFDVYTAEKIYKGVVVSGKLTVTPEVNQLKKIPVIYFKQAKPEWANVQSLITRLELLLSNWADINDYNGSPILVAEGTIKGFAQKGESGKVVEMSKGGKLQYLSWDHAPESVKNEIETLIRLIYTLSNTPDISFENMKGIGATSGYAFEMMFIDSHLRAAKTEGRFGEGIQRRINLFKAAQSNIINVSYAKQIATPIKPRFEYFMPRNTQEMIEVLTTAVQGGVMSKESAIRQNPLVADPDAELELIKAEAPTDAQKLKGVLEKDI